MAALFNMPHKIASYKHCVNVARVPHDSDLLLSISLQFTNMMQALPLSSILFPDKQGKSSRALGPSLLVPISELESSSFKNELQRRSLGLQQRIFREPCSQLRLFEKGRSLPYQHTTLTALACLKRPRQDLLI